MLYIFKAHNQFHAGWLPTSPDVYVEKDAYLMKSSAERQFLLNRKKVFVFIYIIFLSVDLFAWKVTVNKSEVTEEGKNYQKLSEE